MIMSNDNRTAVRPNEAPPKLIGATVTEIEETARPDEAPAKWDDSPPTAEEIALVAEVVAARTESISLADVPPGIGEYERNEIFRQRYEARERARGTDQRVDNPPAKEVTLKQRQAAALATHDIAHMVEAWSDGPLLPNAWRERIKERVQKAIDEGAPCSDYPKGVTTEELDRQLDEQRTTALGAAEHICREAAEDWSTIGQHMRASAAEECADRIAALTNGAQRIDSRSPEGA
jgi:hypothetical protein